MTGRHTIEGFLRGLFARSSGDTLFDPWREVAVDDVDPLGWQGRRARLAQHLAAPDPRFLLVGEAPGYQGCRISGVPFTSERLVLGGAIPRVAQPQGRLSTRSLPWSEPSATIVWKALYALGIAEQTLLWNAVPWHPWKLDAGPFSNRTPTLRERQAGLEVLRELVAALPLGVRVVAVGKTAGVSLVDAGLLPAAVLRHPANGGASAFRAGLEAAVRGELQGGTR